MCSLPALGSVATSAILGSERSPQRGDIFPIGLRKPKQFSLEKGFRLISSYRTSAQDTLWVITEGSRSHTTLLLPSEY